MAEWLPFGDTAATSTTRVTLADGEECTVSLAAPTGSTVPARAYVNVMHDEGSGNADSVAASIIGTQPVEVIRGPGEFYVIRPNLAAEGIDGVSVNSSTTPA